VLGVLLRLLEVGFTAQPAALLGRPVLLARLAGALRLIRTLSGLTRLTLTLRLIRTLSGLTWLLSRLYLALRLIGTLSRLARPLRLLARLVLLTNAQIFLVLGHGGASLAKNVVAPSVRHKLQPVGGTPCRGSRERRQRRLC
jgi:hypothetical protein